MNRSVTLCTIWLSLVCSWSWAQKFQVDTLQKTGPLNRRINLIILGDGFTLSELPQFDQEARKFMAFFLNYTPYSAYKNYFNIFSIRVASNQSGATNPGTAPDRYLTQPVETRDTYFGASFGSATHRNVAIRNYQAFTNVTATNFPSYDLAVMIVNSPWYGGSGGNPATFTLAQQANQIGVHEIGHLFSSLRDEYWPGTDYARQAANMTQFPDASTIVWKNWLNQSNVGIFPHTGEPQASNWYKPTTHNCLMEQLDKPFCAVCRQATANTILHQVEPVDTLQPSADSPVVIQDQPVTFRLTLLKPSPNTLKLDWCLNTIPIDQNVDEVTISNSQLSSLTNTLSVSVLDTTSYIRSETHRQLHTYTYHWTLEKRIPAQTLAITASKSALCLGDSTTLAVSNCSGTLIWSTGATGSVITVSPTQTTTYWARCSETRDGQRTLWVSIEVFPLPLAKASNTGPYTEKQSIQLLAEGGASYSWMGPAQYSSSDQNPSIPFAQMSQAGTYTVMVRSANDCFGKAQTVVSLSPLLALSGSSDDAIRVFPTPAKSRVQIQTALPGELEITLVDAVGHEVLRKLFHRSIELSTEKLPKAIYFYRVKSHQQTIAGKLILE